MIINDDSMKLIFGKTKDYKKEFEIIHNTKNSDDLEFEDIKHKDIIDFVKEIEKKYIKNIKELKQDKNIFRQFIQDARNETDVTLTELADILDLSKSTIHNYHKKK